MPVVDVSSVANSVNDAHCPRLDRLTFMYGQLAGELLKRKTTVGLYIHTYTCLNTLNIPPEVHTNVYYCI